MTISLAERPLSFHQFLEKALCSLFVLTLLHQDIENIAVPKALASATKSRRFRRSIRLAHGLGPAHGASFLDIRVLDHVIIGDEITCLSEKGLV